MLYKDVAAKYGESPLGRWTYKEKEIICYHYGCSINHGDGLFYPLTTLDIFDFHTDYELNSRNEEESTDPGSPSLDKPLVE